MEHVFLDIPRLYTALAEWGACGVYILILNRRFKSNGLTAAVGAAALAIQMFFLQVTGDVALALWIPCMIGAAALMFAYLMIICRINFKTAVYCCAQAFLLAEFAASLEWQLHNYLLILSADWLWLQLLLLAAVYTGVFIAAYFIERPAFSKEYLSQLSVRELISAVGIVVVAFAFSNISFVMTNSPFFGQMKMDMFLIRTIVDFSGITVLYAFQSRICEYIVEKENTMIQAMLKSQYEQYRSYQESMELMHIKYHDLKHQIAGLRAENDSDKRKAWIDALLAFVEENIRLVREFFARYLPQAVICRHRAGSLIWVDLRACGTQEQIDRLFAKANITVDDGSQYGKEGEGFVRLQLGIPREELTRTLSRLLNAGREIKMIA